ncbi:radical SAM protein [uncultured Rhodoblastus sp.]|uniref:radical SAM protein n=1 Tax=uncultured Rhodoblastus sp. TaxID=543037 RepID=UPI0025F0AAAC|nr:radical SAM protein [uncultured Rhodoblastus sp.]
MSAGLTNAQCASGEVGEQEPREPQAAPRVLSTQKFLDPEWTAKGDRRASVALVRLETLWFNTGTLCNLACENCYIESSPKNDRLAYLTRADVRAYLDEIRTLALPLGEIGFTGGEPFMNPDILGMIEDSLEFGARVLVLTNAMKPLQHLKSPLLDLDRRFPGRLALRVSLDHYEATGHEKIRGAGSWAPAIEGLRWLAENQFDLALASRKLWHESEAELRDGFRQLCVEQGLPIDTGDPSRLVLFPEMEAHEDVPEISEGCWAILGKSPDQVMCATSRMVVRRKGASSPVVIACTLLPYDPGFEMGATLDKASRPIQLNHSHCARFCVLGGASCSPRS